MAESAEEKTLKKLIAQAGAHADREIAKSNKDEIRSNGILAKSLREILETRQALSLATLASIHFVAMTMTRRTHTVFERSNRPRCTSLRRSQTELF